MTAAAEKCDNIFYKLYKKGQKEKGIKARLKTVQVKGG